MRVGPGVRYPVKWVFRQKAIPVELVQEYDTWRKIRDWEGAEGYASSHVVEQRSIIVTGRTTTMRRRSSDEAPAVAALGRGMVAHLDKMHPRLVSGRGRRLRRLGSARRPWALPEKRSP